MWNDFFEENFYDRGKIYVMVERGIISAVLFLLCVISFSTPGVNSVFCGVLALIAFVWYAVSTMLLMRKFDRERDKKIAEYEGKNSNFNK